MTDGMTAEEAKYWVEICVQDYIRYYDDYPEEILEARDMMFQALEAQTNRCDSCTHSEEQDGSNCYECVKGMADNFEAQPTEMRDATEEERKLVKDYVESISKPTGVRFDAQPFINKPCVSEGVCREDKIQVLDKIKAEIEEYKSRQLTLAIGVEDLEKGKQIALEYVFAIINKYKAESEE